jgi:hypothetical protein
METWRPPLTKRMIRNAMADQQITDLAGIAKIAESKLAQQIYSDGLQPGTKEVGKLLGALSKTTRMVLQPMLTVLQGASKRLDDWVTQAVRQVPPERLVKAKPVVLRATVAAIGAEDDKSEMRGYYVKLLASMMDRELQHVVHPAFPRLLQELSPLDALLLQVTPYGSEVSLPEGFEQPPYVFTSGLVVTWETWKQGDANVGRWRGFLKVGKQQPEAVGNATFVGKGSDHVGFLEIVLPQEPLFRDKGVAWSNLERLGLTALHREKDIKTGNFKPHFWNEPAVLDQISGLLVGDLFFGAQMYHRTELGRAFAYCCIPEFTGGTKWHPFQNLSQPQASNDRSFS